MGRKKSRKVDSDEIVDSTPEVKKEENTQNVPQKIKFNSWFCRKIKAKDRWLENSIREFMKTKGLSEEETEKRFDEVYKKF